MKVRLHHIGLKPGPQRSRALIHLAQRMEAPLLARTPWAYTPVPPSGGRNWLDAATAAMSAAQPTKTPR